MDQEREKTSTSVPREEAKADWLKEQDTQLQNLVESCGTKDWAVVSEALNVAFPTCLKSARQCCNRWQELFEDESAKKAWTEQDELSMIIAHKKHKNRWADISEALKGRSNNTIKNKFYSVFRKIRGKILKCDCSYVSKLELLEIHYIVSLIEQYLAHPLLVPKTKGKRGKDFIYSLIHSLNDKMVADYKTKVQDLAKSEGTMEELFTKLSAQLKASTEKNGNGSTAAGPSVSIAPAANHNIEKLRPRINGGVIHKKDEADGANAVKDCQQVPCNKMIKMDEDKLFSVPYQKDAIIDSSPLFGYGAMSPPFVFSPNPLSAGPAAAAAGAARAPCFRQAENDFSEVSYRFKLHGEEPKGEAVYQVPRPVTAQMKGMAPRTFEVPSSNLQGQSYPMVVRTHYHIT